jgi:hypothetical protein
LSAISLFGLGSTLSARSLFGQGSTLSAISLFGQGSTLSAISVQAMPASTALLSRQGQAQPAKIDPTRHSLAETTTYTQQPDTTALKGTWTLERAIINRQINGQCEQVRILTAQEAEAKKIPSVLTFTGAKLTATIQQQKKTSQYTFDKAFLTFGEKDEKSVFMAWKESDTVLVLISEYKQTDFDGNELRLTYKKNP